MKDRKNSEIIIFVIVCMLLNIVGKVFASRMMLPIWLDCVGTAISAYVMGPVCAAIIGFTSNLAFGIFSIDSISYALVNALVGIVVGMCAKQKMIERFFDSMTVAALVTLVSVIVSTPLNIFFYEGNTGNIWGDGVIIFMSEKGFPNILSCLIGEFYIDFVDKILSITILFFALKLYRSLKKGSFGENKNTKLLIVTVLLSAAMSLCLLQNTEAAEIPANRNEYSSYVRTIYSKSEGLLGGTASCVAGTEDGIIWIGTYGGLYRFNGKSFKLMEEYDSVKNVNALYVDGQGRLWIGTNDSGLTIAVDEEIENVLTEAEGLPNNSVRSIVGDNNENYYVGTAGSMGVISLMGGLSIEKVLPEIQYAVSTTANSTGDVAAVTSVGQLFLLRDGDIVTSLDGVEDTGNTDKKSETFTACCYDSADRLIAATTDDRLLVYEASEKGFKLIKTIECEGMAVINGICRTENGRIFVCADSGFGYISFTDSFKKIQAVEFSDSIQSMTTDYQGNLWFVSSRKGAMCMSEAPFMDLFDESGLPEAVTNSVISWRGKYFFGTDNGLVIIDKNNHKRLENNITKALEGVRIRSVMQMSNGALWIATTGSGIWSLNPDWTYEVFDINEGTLGSKFRCFAELPDNTVAAAGDAGITFIKNSKVTGTIGIDDGLANSKVLSIMLMKDGRLMAGTDGGGIAIIRDGKVEKTLRRADGLISDIILRTVQDRDVIFIVCGSGLMYMDEKEQLHNIKDFPYYNIFEVICQGETVMVPSGAGIYVINREALLSGEKFDYDLYDEKRGLRSTLTVNAWNYMDAAKNIYLSTNQGVVFFNLDKLSNYDDSYRLFMKNVLADDKRINIDNDSDIVFERDTYRIEFFPEIINFTTVNPYMGIYLKGFDSEPKIMHQKEVSSVVYTNLPPGKYELHVTVYNSNMKVIEDRVYNVIKKMEIQDYPFFHIYILLVIIMAVAWFSWFVTRGYVQGILVRQREQIEYVNKQVQMGNETILAIARTVDAKDANTSQHSTRVSEYSVLIAKRLGYDESYCENIRKIALLHDIGKIGIPDKVLNKPAKLDDEEYAIMKSHVTRGAEILKDFSIIEDVAVGALYHHERYDGKGYVHGLKGEEIPLKARIIGIADAFDAMTANRVYRKKLDLDFVIEELKRCSGGQFDPQLVDIMLSLIEDGTIDVNRIYAESTETNK